MQKWFKNINFEHPDQPKYCTPPMFDLWVAYIAVHENSNNDESQKNAITSCFNFLNNESFKKSLSQFFGTKEAESKIWKTEKLSVAIVGSDKLSGHTIVGGDWTCVTGWVDDGVSREKVQKEIVGVYCRSE